MIALRVNLVTAAVHLQWSGGDIASKYCSLLANLVQLQYSGKALMQRNSK
jgi:hypothetical protein